MLNFLRTCCVSLMVLKVVPTFSRNWFQFFSHSSKSCGLPRRLSGSAFSVLQMLRSGCGLLSESEKCFSNFFKSNNAGSGCHKNDVVPNTRNKNDGFWHTFCFTFWLLRPVSFALIRFAKYLFCEWF